jgi:hypothetical protein
MAKQKGDATALERVRMSQAKLQGLVIDKQEQRVGSLDPIEAAPDISQVWASSVAPKTDEHETKH